MAVPALPANLANGAVYPESFADDVRALLAFLRDGIPILNVDNNIGTAVNTGTNTPLDFSGVAPSINQGGWVAGTTGWDAPETGYYLIVGTCIYDNTDGDGRRYVRIRIDGSAPSDYDDVILPQSTTDNGWGTAANVQIQSTYVGRVTAGEEVQLYAFQDSGTNLNVRGRLYCVWLNS